MRFFLIIKLSLLTLVLSCQSEKSTDRYIAEGGYDFSKKYSDKDTLLYIYPIKDSIPADDSFTIATYSEFLYRSFNEPNISLAQPEKPVYRLVYQPGFSRYTAILVLQDQNMIIKELKTGYAVPYEEKDKLDSLEQEDLHLLQMYYPLNKYSGNERKKKYLDSLIKQHPKLLDAKYYRSLIIKTNTLGSEPFSYTKREIPLSKKKYDYFMNLIARSGYWKMKPVLLNCLGEATHPDGYSLEAAVQNKYNFVEYMDCEKDTSGFAKAIKELLTYSKIDENERKWHHKLIEGIKNNKE